MSNSKILSTEDLFLTGGDKVLFKHLCFSVQQGERVGIYGPNGSGKTTLLRALLGVVRPSAGNIFLGEQLVHTISAHEQGKILGYLPQSFETLPPLTVEELCRSVWCHRYGAFADYAEQKISSLLSQMNLSRHAGTPLTKLSGGEVRRLFFGMALLKAPELLLLDEPFVSLDGPSKEAMILLIENFLTERSNLSIVIVSHDHKFLFQFCTKIFRVSEFDLILERGERSPEEDSSKEWIQ